MENVDVEQLLHDLDNLDDSVGSVVSPSRNRESLQQAKDMDDLTGTLDDLLLLTETGMDEELERGPLTRRTLRISKEADEGSASESTLPANGELMTPRPPLVPKRKKSPSICSSKNLTPCGDGAETSISNSNALSANGSGTTSMNSALIERMISTEVESELENLLDNSQGASEPSSPLKNKSPTKTPASARVRDSDSVTGHEYLQQTTPIFHSPILDVDDFDDAPHCAMVGARPAAIPVSSVPKPMPSQPTQRPWSDSLSSAELNQTNSEAIAPP